MKIPTLLVGDCLDVLRELPDASVDAVVTDPPYGLGFMGKAWDNAAALHRPPSAAAGDTPLARFRTGKGPKAVAFDGLTFQLWCQEWTTECLRVLKPGGHLLAFGGTRTWHRLACAVEDAGFEVRDSIAWLYGSGFPKSLDVSKAIDKAARGVPQGGTDPTSPNHGQYRTTTTEGKRWDGDSGQGYGAGGSRFLADGRGNGSATERAASGDAAAALDPAAREWQGWGTALKPAFEPVVVARKPLGEKTVAANVLEHGTGALNIDACRIGSGGQLQWAQPRDMGYHGGTDSGSTEATVNAAGRWPANVVLDESQAEVLDEQSGKLAAGNRPRVRNADKNRTAYGDFEGQDGLQERRMDSGGASRFFYVAKAPKKERPVVEGSPAHPTVKPLALMRWLVRLVTPPDGIVLDPFAGSGTTLEAAMLEDRHVIVIERELDYLPLIRERFLRNVPGNLVTTEGVSPKVES